MNWRFVDQKGMFMSTTSNFQMDTVGNILQINGGVNPKACQKCYKEFKSEIKPQPIIQKVPFYVCEDCDFKNSGSGATLDHKLETDHKIKKISEDRIINYNNTLVGLYPKINFTEDDCIILCQECEKV